MNNATRDTIAVAILAVGQYVSFVVEHDWDTGDWIISMSLGVHVFG